MDTGGLGFATAALGVAVWGGGLGVTGLAIGAMIKSEKWEIARIPSTSGRLRISPMFDVASLGGNRRALLGARVRF